MKWIETIARKFSPSESWRAEFYRDEAIYINLESLLFFGSWASIARSGCVRVGVDDVRWGVGVSTRVA